MSGSRPILLENIQISPRTLRGHMAEKVKKIPISGHYLHKKIDFENLNNLYTLSLGKICRYPYPFRLFQPEPNLRQH
jgi:hypothetical protein